MTNTVNIADEDAAAKARTPRRAKPPTLSSVAVLSRTGGESLVEQIVRTVQSRIDDKLLRSGARMPSIRQFAESHAVSRFTVVEAYDRLVARGVLESRRGSGFFVRELTPMSFAHAAPAEREHAERKQPPLDVVWLVRNMFRQ